MIKLAIKSFLHRNGENIAVVSVTGLWPGDLAEQEGCVRCEDLIQLGRACENQEQGEAKDAAANLDMGRLADKMLGSMNKLACMGNLKGGQNEA